MENDKIKIIFFGTPEFGKIILEKLLEQKNFSILAIVAAPDKPVGRKQVLTPPPVKVLAEKNNIPVLQSEKLDDNFYHELDSRLHGNDNKGTGKIDLFIVAAYGKIIPQNILDIPRYGSLNVHPSLLPKYRGASPIQATLLNGDKKTGVTIMKMDEKMDHGPIIADCRLKIADFDTYETLAKKLAKGGADLLVKTIPLYLAGKIKLKEQDHNQATFCKMVKKEDGEIDWTKSAEEIYNQWRAFYPWPGVFSQLTVNSKQLTIKFVEIRHVETRHCLVSTNTNIKPGEFFILDSRLFKSAIKADLNGNDNKGKKLCIACSNNSFLEIKKLQPEGKKVMTAEEFINGYLRQTL